MLRAGIDRVKRLGIERCGVALIAPTKDAKYNQTLLASGEYLFTNLSTPDKKKVLDTINAELQLGWRVELVDKDGATQSVAAQAPVTTNGALHPVAAATADGPFFMPVNEARFNSGLMVLSGDIEFGTIRKGDRVKISNGMQLAVYRIVVGGEQRQQATAGEEASLAFSGVERGEEHLFSKPGLTVSKD